MTEEWMTVETDVEPAYSGGDWTDDLSDRANYWLPKALARAQSVAPCLRGDVSGLPDYILESAKGIIAGAVLRLLDDSSGARQYETAGPFAVNQDTKVKSDRILTIADRDELRQLCRKVTRRRRSGTIRTPIGY